MTKLLCVLIIFTSISGCTSKMAYNNIDWLAAWYIDDYIDLSGPQSDEFDAKVKGILKWHRHFELVQYQSQLQQIKAQITQGEVSQQLWFNHLETIGEHWVRARNKISGELVLLAPTLNQQQINALFNELKDNNQQKREDFHELSQQEALDERYEKVIEQFEENLGDVTDSQQALVREYVLATNYSPIQYLDYSDRFQLALKKAFEDTPSNQLPGALLSLLLNPEQFRTQESVQEYALNRRLLAELLKNVQISLTQQQQGYFIGELDQTLTLLKDILAEQANQ